MKTEHTSDITLTGLDGANPLAFLAALGTLHTLTEAWPERAVRLGWSVEGGAWRPFLRLSGSEPDEGEITEAVHEHVPPIDELFPPELRAEAEAAGPHSRAGNPQWREKLRFPREVYVRHARMYARSGRHNDRRRLDVIAALASDAVVDELSGIEIADRTQLDFTAGQQSFIALVESLAEALDADQIQNALFGPWCYTAAAVSLRWDPLDEGRQYALHAVNPADGSNNPIVSVPGANLLAAAGLIFFPIVAGTGRARQPGFGYFGTPRTRAFRWPLWEAPLSSRAARSVLTLEALCAEPLDHEELRAMGIPIIYQSRIVMPSGRYRNFTPAEAL